MRKAGFLLIVAYLLPAILLFTIAFRLFYFNYHEFTAYLAGVLQKPEWEKYIQQRFTASAFSSARWIIGILIFFNCMLGIYLLINRKKLIFSLYSILSGFIKKIRQLKNEYKTMPAYARRLFIFLFLFIFLKAGWYIINWPLQYDETWTYNYYIGNSFWQSFLLPHNNHTFFTTVAWFFQILPVDPQISMRLPNIFAGLLLIILFFFFIKRHVSVHAALIATFFLATCCSAVFYMLFARGYLFVMLFTIIALWSQLIVLKEGRSRFYKIILFVSVVLGYWSNPVFIYPHAVIGLTMILFLLQKKEFKILWKNILIHAPAILFVMILYLPTLLSSHIHELANKGVQQSFEIDILWKSFFYNARFIFGFDKAYILFILIILLFAWVSIRRKRFSVLQWFVVMSFAVVFLFSFLQSLPLAGHITIFFAISAAIMLAYIFNAIKINTHLMFLLLTGITMFNSYMAHTHHWLNWSVQYDKGAKKLSNEMLTRNIQSCYLLVNYYKPHLEYYYKVNGKKIKVNLPDSASQDFRPFDPVEQEVVIARTDLPATIPLQNYSQFYKDETITAFIRVDVNR